jgi:hypothetical protein
MEHDILPLAYGMQAQGPDEYPFGFYVEMARQRLNLSQTLTGRTKRIRPESVLW